MSVAVSGAAPVPAPSVPGEVLALLYAHRLLSTRQVHALHRPDGSLRSVQRVLAGLRAKGLVEYGRARSSVTEESLWYVTEQGAKVAAAGARGRDRGYQMTAAQAIGRLREHTLRVNDVGLAFVAAARLREGDDCGGFDWDHEIGFAVTDRRARGRPKADLCIPDAVLRYERRWDHNYQPLTFFIEVDRGTETVEKLRDKLRAYARLRAYKPPPRAKGPVDPLPGGWRGQFVSFPPVVVVFCDRSRAVMVDRRDRMLVQLYEDPVMRKAMWEEQHDAVVVMATTLPQLVERGPFAPIFWRPDGEHPVDVLGHGASEREAAGSEKVGNSPAL